MTDNVCRKHARDDVHVLYLCGTLAVREFVRSLRLSGNRVSLVYAPAIGRPSGGLRGFIVAAVSHVGLNRCLHRHGVPLFAALIHQEGVGHEQALLKLCSEFCVRRYQVTATCAS